MNKPLTFGLHMVLGVLFTLLLSPVVFGLNITDVRVEEIRGNSAVIVWDTDELSTGTVRYGEGSDLTFSKSHGGLATVHAVRISTGLRSGIPYFFEVESSTGGVSVIDDNQGILHTFTTLDTVAPPQVFGLHDEEIGSRFIKIEWGQETSDDFSHFIVFKNRQAIANVTSNFFTDENVTPGENVFYQVAAVDLSGNRGSLSDGILLEVPELDETAPTISGVSFANRSLDTIVLSWITNEDANGFVSYTTGNLESTAVQAEFSQNHSLPLPNLINGSTYVFTLTSCDPSANCANHTGTFIAGVDVTPPPLNISIPTVSNRRVINVIGDTEPFSEVHLFVNNLNVPIRILEREDIGETGEIFFKGVFLEEQSTVKVVSIDISGNRREFIQNVEVDTRFPIVSLANVPEIVSNRDIQISGQVSEFVTARVFIRAADEEFEEPQNITGFTNGSVGKNHITLTWESVNDDDFSHYIIRRSPLGIIAIANPQTYNTFTDILVDSGQEYTYAISYANTFGVESALTEPLTVRTKPGGRILGLQPPVIESIPDFRETEFIQNVSEGFVLNFSFPNEDAEYIVKFEFTDRAGNIESQERKITLDTQAPEIEITRPSDGALIFENFAGEVDIIGNTEPGARVHLFVNRNPFNSSIEFSGLADELQNIDPGDFEGTCRSIIRNSRQCQTSADFSTTADEFGDFKFEDVDLQGVFSFGGTLQETNLRGDSNPSRFSDGDRNPRKRTELNFVAIDKAGLLSTETTRVDIGNCFSGNLTWDIISLIEHQSPTFLSAERLAENTESIYFYFNYSYNGVGKNPEIFDVFITKACSDEELLEGRFETSCQILPSSIGVEMNDERTISYSTAKLDRLEGMEQFLQADWENFFDAASNELTFPLKVTIRYRHDVNGQQNTETQTACQEVTYVLDNTKIDPRDVLPDWLLYDFVDFLQSASQSIQEVQEGIDGLIQVAATGCVVSFGANTAAKIYRNLQVFYEESKIKTEEITKIFTSLGGEEGTEQQRTYCQQLVETFKKHPKYGKGRGDFKLKWLSDKDLKQCFPHISSAWEAEETTYQAKRATCDRLFGNSAPSAWTETKADKDLFAKLGEGQVCADITAKGSTIRAEDCRRLAEKFESERSRGIRVDDYERGEICFEVRSYENGEIVDRLYELGREVQTNVFEITNTKEAGAVRTRYVVKVTDDNYLTNQPTTCSQICGESEATGGTDNPGSVLETRYIDNRPEELRRQGIGANEVRGVCMPATQCIDLKRRVNQDENIRSTDVLNRESGTGFRIESVERQGFTEGCFYDPNSPRSDLRSIDAIGDDPDDRWECCCLTTGDVERSRYYTAGDTYLAAEGFAFPFQSNNRQVHETSKDDFSLKPGDVQPLEFSYRYWKNEFESESSGVVHKAYNPNRYIEGRDIYACFGQDNWLYKAFGEEEKQLILDSGRDWLPTFQCANLGGLQNRLTEISNAMNLLSNCLIQVRTTGTADSGVCKELFTQYVCSLTWDAIQFVTTIGNQCSVLQEFVGDASTSEVDGIAQFIRGGTTSIYGALEDSATEFTSEYENTELNRMFGIGGPGGIARKMCLAAFGYDWDINVQSFIDAAYAQPFATLVQPVTASREFLNVEPSGNAKYEYRTSWVINPGCDIRSYRVDLACINQETLESGTGANCGETENFFSQTQQSPNGVNCGCLNAPSESRKAFFSSNGGLAQNDFIEEDHHAIVESPFRYDHFRFKIDLDQRIDEDLVDRCFPEGHEDGVFYTPITDRTARDLLNCRFDFSTGQLNCQEGVNFFNPDGTAHFTSIKINGNDAEDVRRLQIGQPLKLTVNTFRSGEKDKCMLLEFGARGANPDAKRFFPLKLDGTNTLTDYTLVESVQVTGQASGAVTLSSGIQGHMTARELNEKTLEGDFTFSVSISDLDNNRIFDENDFKDSNPTIAGAIITSSALGSGQEISVPVSEGTLTVTARVTETQPVFTIRRVIDGKELTVLLNNINFESPNGVPKRNLRGDITANANFRNIDPQEDKVLELTLFELKENSERFRSQSDCDISRPIRFQGQDQQKEFVLTVSSTEGDDGTDFFGADVRSINFRQQQDEATTRSSIFDSTKDIEALAAVRARTGNLRTVRASLLDPTGAPVDLGASPVRMTPVQQGTGQFKLTIPADKITGAGQYTFTVEATDDTVPPSTTTESQTFEVSCALELGGTDINAQCRERCNDNRIVNPPQRKLVCADTDKKSVCCSSTVLRET